MRWALLVLLVAVPALARPKAAVAPLDGDDDQKVSTLVADAAGDHAKVTGPDRVAKAMDHLSITSFKGRDLKKLRSNLEVDVIIHGAVTKNGSKKHLALTLSGKGKQKETVELDFKTTKTLKKELASALGKKLDAAAGGGNDDDADDDDTAKPFGDSPKSDEKRAQKSSDDDDKPKKSDDDDKPKKHASDDDDKPKRHASDDDDKPKRHASDDDDKPKKHASDDDRPKKHADDDDRPRKRTADADVRKHSDDGDDDRPRRRKHHRGDDDDDGPPRNPITQAAAWVDAGGNFTRHTLTWTGTGMNVPPGVGTAAASAAVEGELYPGSFSSLKGGGAALGLYGAYEHAMGLGIPVPGTNVTAPIKQDHYEVGARYRIIVGTSSIALGAAYWRRTYVADRGNLGMATLDTPDISYTAVAPGISARIAAAPKVGIVLQADVPLMLDGGPIVKGTSYGAATILAFDVSAGLQILLAPHVALQLRGDFNRDAFTFAAKAQSMAATRGVTGATDMNYGLTATIGLLY